MNTKSNKWIVWYRTNGFEINPHDPVEHQEIMEYRNLFGAIKEYMSLKLAFVGVIKDMCGFKVKIIKK